MLNIVYVFSVRLYNMQMYHLNQFFFHGISPLYGYNKGYS